MRTLVNGFRNNPDGANREVCASERAELRPMRRRRSPARLADASSAGAASADGAAQPGGRAPENTLAPPERGQAASEKREILHNITGKSIGARRGPAKTPLSARPPTRVSSRAAHALSRIRGARRKHLVARDSADYDAPHAERYVKHRPVDAMNPNRATRASNRRVARSIIRSR